MNKKRFLLSAIVAITIFFPAMAQRIQVIDWINNPACPVPYTYTANHMKINGKVKQLSETWKDDYSGNMMILTYAFSTEGELEKQSYSNNSKVTRVTVYRDTVYTFMPDGVTVMEASTFNGETTNTEISFFKKQITSRILFGGTDKSFQKTVTRYTHNDKGWLTASNKLDMGTQSTKEKYTYNTGGQLIKSEYSANDELSSWKELSYTKEGNRLSVSTWYRFSSGNDYQITDVYNEAGLLIKSTRSSDKKEFSYEYSLDKNNNWTTRIQTEKNTATGVQKVTTKTRTIEYY